MANSLSAAFVRTVNRPGRYGDGRGGFGLALDVRERAGGGIRRMWTQRIRVNGHATNLGLGAYPVVTLAGARAAALSNARAVQQGRDPRAARVPTFRAALDKVIALHAPTWKHPARQAREWRNSLEAHAMQRIGGLLVSKVTAGDVLAVLVPLWNTKRPTAQLVRQRIGTVMKWAVANRYRDDNPAGDAIGAALPKSNGPRNHHRALPHGEVSAALNRVRELPDRDAIKLAFELMVLTAVRSVEVRGATWSEFDIEDATWTIPAARMKGKREHRVPLSGAARAVLDRARELTGGRADALVFPAARGGRIQDFVFSRLCRAAGIAAVPHGFRSSFRDWCGDTGKAREVAEACLAHQVGGVEGAYARSDLFERRRGVMDGWAAYLAGQRAKVVRIA
ncbi:MAG: tyrosine-type recombinase/integrase [Acidobacteria bacterium]|nr:tyrosine-type recombinase/integrase [Acidobacteriota bacterium]